jgi:hypothetical protein
MAVTIGKPTKAVPGLPDTESSMENGEGAVMPPKKEMLGHHKPEMSDVDKNIFEITEIGEHGDVNSSASKVTFGLQALVSTGSYENVRVNIEITQACDSGMEQIDAAFNDLKDYVDTQMFEILQEIKHSDGADE